MNGETMKRTWADELSEKIPEVLGREIDIFMPSDREAQQFGRRNVRVEVLEYAAAD